MPNINELRKDTKRPKFIIMDDLMTNVKNKDMDSLFTRGVHHWNISVCFLMQNLFFNGLRTSRINAHYLVLFRNPSDKLQIRTLAKQLYPKNSTHFINSFEDATSEPYTYLLVDLTQTCPDNLRLRTNIFPGELTFVYPI